MSSVMRAVVVYLFLLALFRLAGKRSLSQVTTFDLVLTLIISEAVQQALISDDNSMTNAFLLVLTLVGLDILLSFIKQRSQRLSRLLDGTPVVVVEDGRLLRDRMKRERVDEGDILHAAREHQGLASLDEIAYAVVERSGGITVVPKHQDG
ncbi:MAG: DUF421 domain-containing protein [Gemmatimonadales bacterium]|nr:DUF421 domain-containing protein [Gemmatimonadales bacterium]